VTIKVVEPATARSGSARSNTGAGFGGGNTLTLAAALFPSLVAVMVAVPGPTAVVVPELLTAATDVLLDAHATVLPLRTFPDWSSSAILNDTAAPTTIVVSVGETVTRATAAGESLAPGGGVEASSIPSLQAPMRNAAHVAATRRIRGIDEFPERVGVPTMPRLIARRNRLV
jgi:hypothetical protein